MTQLDLFSLAPTQAVKEKIPLPAQQPEQSLPDIEQVTKMSEEHEVVNENLDKAALVTSKTVDLGDIASNGGALNAELSAGDGRSGDIVFEDSRISVKIKARSTAKKDSTAADGEVATGKPAKRYGLPSLPELSQKVEPRKSIVTKQPKSAFSDALREKLDSVKNGIKDGLLKEAIAEKKKKEKAAQPPQKRGRKSFKTLEATVDLLQIPADDELFNKQYYPISQVAGWFSVNTSLLRFWENEFDILKPRKNRKGDRMFRPEDVKNLQLIYELLRQRKYSIEGAKEYLKNNKNKADMQVQLTQTLLRFKSFLLELKANL